MAGHRTRRERIGALLFMKVKVGDIIYNDSEFPIMVILTNDDKENIANMNLDATKYCAFPADGWKEEDVKKWMEEDGT